MMSALDMLFPLSPSGQRDAHRDARDALDTLVAGRVVAAALDAAPVDQAAEREAELVGRRGSKALPHQLVEVAQRLVGNGVRVLAGLAVDPDLAFQRRDRHLAGVVVR